MQEVHEEEEEIQEEQGGEQTRSSCLDSVEWIQGSSFEVAG